MRGNLNKTADLSNIIKISLLTIWLNWQFVSIWYLIARWIKFSLGHIWTLPWILNGISRTGFFWSGQVLYLVERRKRLISSENNFNAIKPLHKSKSKALIVGWDLNGFRLSLNHHSKTSVRRFLRWTIGFIFWLAPLAVGMLMFLIEVLIPQVKILLRRIDMF